MMLQQDKPDDFVIATGEQFSVRDFILWSAAELGITLSFSGSGLEEVGLITKIEGNDAPALKVGDIIVRIDRRYFRPAEVDTLLGDPSKAKEKLGWEPKISTLELCKEMVSEDKNNAKKQAYLKNNYDL